MSSTEVYQNFGVIQFQIFLENIKPDKTKDRAL